MGQLSFVDRLIYRIRKADSPLTKLAKRMLALLTRPTVAPLPRSLAKPLRLLYELHFLTIMAARAIVTLVYRNPVFQARCASFGRDVAIAGKLPFVVGPVQLHIGNSCYLGGNLSIMSGSFMPEPPRFVLGNHSELGWNVFITVNKEILIEENVRIPNDCRISDSDGHPRQADLRRQGLPPRIEDVRPVRICRDVWVGNGSHIMKGVTVGEGAIIGANSVVITDVPPYSLALGNPAEVYFRNYGKPTRPKPGNTAGPTPE